MDKEKEFEQPEQTQRPDNDTVIDAGHPTTICEGSNTAKLPDKKGLTKSSESSVAKLPDKDLVELPNKDLVKLPNNDLVQLPDKGLVKLSDKELVKLSEKGLVKLSEKGLMEVSDKDAVKLPYKFASLHDFVVAYENLEQEFTRKSQELAKIKRSIADGSVSVTSGSMTDNTVNTPMNSQSIQNTTQTNLQMGNHQIINAEGDKPQNATQINRQLISPSVAGSDNAETLSSVTLSPQTVNNAKVSARADEDVIKQYLLAVATKQMAPTVIAKPVSDFACVPDEAKKSLRNASAVVKNFFEMRVK